VTETLEETPRRFKLIEKVREKFTCRDCGKVSQPPAPFHTTPRGFIGPQLLATILFDKFGMHVPLNRQSTRFKVEGIDLPLSTLADQVGHGAFALKPVFDLIENHVLAAERLHGDDTTVPILAKGKCATGRIWTYVRDDSPFGGADPPAALYVIAGTSIPMITSRAGGAFCRPTPMAATTACTSRAARIVASRLVLSWSRKAGGVYVGNSLCRRRHACNLDLQEYPVPRVLSVPIGGEGCRPPDHRRDQVANPWQGKLAGRSPAVEPGARRRMGVSGTVRISVCGRRVEHQAAIALVKRSPKMTAN